VSGVPTLSIVVPVEGEVRLRIDALTEEEERALYAWLANSPALPRVAAFALELFAELLDAEEEAER
jgi:hypothetical protein